MAWSEKSFLLSTQVFNKHRCSFFRRKHGSGNGGIFHLDNLAASFVSMSEEERTLDVRKVYKDNVFNKSLFRLLPVVWIPNSTTTDETINRYKGAVSYVYNYQFHPSNRRGSRWADNTNFYLALNFSLNIFELVLFIIKFTSYGLSRPLSAASKKTIQQRLCWN